jgi:hypothetical protein
MMRPTGGCLRCGMPVVARGRFVLDPVPVPEGTVVSGPGGSLVRSLDPPASEAFRYRDHTCPKEAQQ